MMAKMEGTVEIKINVDSLEMRRQLVDATLSIFDVLELGYAAHDMPVPKKPTVIRACYEMMKTELAKPEPCEIFIGTITATIDKLNAMDRTTIESIAGVNEHGIIIGKTETQGCS